MVLSMKHFSDMSAIFTNAKQTEKHSTRLVTKLTYDYTAGHIYNVF